MISNKRELYKTFALFVIAAVAATMLFASPAWAQGKQEEEQVSEAQKARIEAQTPKQLEDSIVRTAQTSAAAGDLSRDTAQGRDTDNPSNNIDLITIAEGDCRVSNEVKSQFFCNFLQDGTSSSCCCSSSHESNFPLLSLDAWRIPLG